MMEMRMQRLRDSICFTLDDYTITIRRAIGHSKRQKRLPLFSFKEAAKAPRDFFISSSGSKREGYWNAR